jgi:hypothetical protein
LIHHPDLLVQVGRNRTQGSISIYSLSAMVSGLDAAFLALHPLIQRRNLILGHSQVKFATPPNDILGTAGKFMIHQSDNFALL